MFVDWQTKYLKFFPNLSTSTDVTQSWSAPEYFFYLSFFLFFHNVNIDKCILKFTCKCKEQRISKILKKKDKYESVMLIAANTDF